MNVKISKAVFTLNKLNGNPETHVKLIPDMASYTTSMLPGVPVFCKIATVSTDGPYTLEFNYHSSGDLHVFLTQNPNEIYPDQGRSQI